MVFLLFSFIGVVDLFETGALIQDCVSIAVTGNAFFARLEIVDSGSNEVDNHQVCFCRLHIFSHVFDRSQTMLSM